jgi:hypothetical protein
MGQREKLMKVFFAMLVAAVLAAGCGGDGDSDATCSSTGAAICEAACDCGGSAGCSIGDEEGSITFDSKSDCLMLYALGCSGDTGEFDYGPCQAALKSPTCVASSDGMALKTPPECDVPDEQ